MAFGLRGVVQGTKAFCRTLSGLKEAALKSATIPKGYFAVYVGQDKKKRHVLPVSYLDEPAFQKLLSLAEKEFGYEHPMGGLTAVKTSLLMSLLSFEQIVTCSTNIDWQEQFC